MCAPVALPLAALALQTVQAVSGYQRKEANMAAQRQQAANQARQYEYEARRKELEQQRLEYDRQEAVRDKERQRAKTDGVSRLLTAARGVEVDSGSALDVLLDSAERTAEDVFSLNENAKRKQEQLGQQVYDLRFNARDMKKRSKDNRTVIEKGLAAYDSFSPLL